jgi:hypothetical protein
VSRPRREAEAPPASAAENASPHLGWHMPRLSSACAGGGQIGRGDVLPVATHSALFGLMPAEKLKPFGVDSVVTYSGVPEGRFKSATGYFLRRLKSG